MAVVGDLFTRKKLRRILRTINHQYWSSLMSDKHEPGLINDKSHISATCSRSSLKLGDGGTPGFQDGCCFSRKENELTTRHL